MKVADEHFEIVEEVAEDRTAVVDCRLEEHNWGGNFVQTEELGQGAALGVGEVGVAAEEDHDVVDVAVRVVEGVGGHVVEDHVAEDHAVASVGRSDYAAIEVLHIHLEAVPEGLELVGLCRTEVAVDHCSQLADLGVEEVLVLAVDHCNHFVDGHMVLKRGNRLDPPDSHLVHPEAHHHRAAAVAGIEAAHNRTEDAAAVAEVRLMEEGPAVAVEVGSCIVGRPTSYEAGSGQVDDDGSEVA
jgi:hypothetical protein